MIVCLYLTVLLSCMLFFCFKQKTAYEMRISDGSSDVCSSDLAFSPDGSEVFAGYSVNDGPVSLVRSNLAATSRTTLASDDFGSIGDVEWNAARQPFAA